MGMTATTETDGQRGKIAELLGVPHCALPAATVSVPRSANMALYPDMEFEFVPVHKGCCRDSVANRVFRPPTAEIRKLCLPNAWRPPFVDFTCSRIFFLMRFVRFGNR